MMEGVYFFGELSRWNLGWNNPNPAGAFVAMWIPWLWGLAAVIETRIGWRWKTAGWLVLLVEASLFFLLCKTYSRGALVALATGAGVCVCVEILRGNIRSKAGLVSLRLGIAILLIFITGFFARIEPSYVTSDASAENRLTLWQGGLRMIAASPLTGWGVGQSGPAFMHWFQPLEAEEGYAGLVNSYLHIAVEHGLPMLALCLAPVGTLLALGWHEVRKSERSGGRSMALAAVGSLSVFLMANVFSTLWIFKSLWWPPAVAAVWIVGAGLRLQLRSCERIVGRSLVAGVAFSCVLVAALWLGGQNAREGELVSLLPDGSILCYSGSDARAEEMILLADRATLGDSWGKEVRRLALDRPHLRIVVPGEGRADSFEAPGTVKWIVACGQRGDEGIRTRARYPDANLVLIHPVGQVPELEGPVYLALPGLDTRRKAKVWRAAAERNGWLHATSPGIGQDVRANWPGIVDQFVPKAAGLSGRD